MAEKLRGTQVWVSTPERLPPAPQPKATLGVGCGRGSPPLAVRVRGYPPKIFENSDAKSCILVITCCEITCFLKTMANKLGDQYIVGLPTNKSGDQYLPVPTVVAPMNLTFMF